MMVTGDLVGANYDLCFIPIFLSTATQNDIWYLGNLFMNNYYVVFDQTPPIYDSGADYLKIGLAPQTPKSLVYQEGQMVPSDSNNDSNSGTSDSGNVPTDGGDSGNTGNDGNPGSSNTMLYIGGGAGVGILIAIVAVCACRKKKGEETPGYTSSTGI
jgi:hypothetical protein